mgnify:CR=1 FL=1
MDRVDEISKVFEALKISLNLDQKETRVREIEGETTDPTLWENPERAKKLLQELSDLTKEVGEIENLEKEILALQRLANEGIEIEGDIKKIDARINKLKAAIYLSGPYDKKNSLILIHAGQGGVEAMDWAEMLLRMYFHYCERRGWKLDILEKTRGEEAGIKSITFKVEGNFSYGYLKNESGTHRLVRQSPFNADNLRQTSFALVEVLPQLDEVDLPDIVIKEEDLDWQFFRSSSQGGQNVQKVSTAVRVTHKPSGIIVATQTERFQEQNRKIALNLLRAKLWLRSIEEAKRTKSSLKGEYKPASWGTQIRSYVLHPYKMVKDLRTQVETSDTQAVLEGDLDRFIEAELKLSDKAR